MQECDRFHAKKAPARLTSHPGHGIIKVSATFSGGNFDVHRTAESGRSYDRIIHETESGFRGTAAYVRGVPPE